MGNLRWDQEKQRLVVIKRGAIRVRPQVISPPRGASERDELHALAHRKVPYPASALQPQNDKEQERQKAARAQFEEKRREMRLQHLKEARAVVDTFLTLSASKQVAGYPAARERLSSAIDAAASHGDGERYEGLRDEGLALHGRLREAFEAAERHIARSRRKR